MREIKFRAWDKKYKEMIKDIWIAPEYDWNLFSDNDAMCERARPEQGQIVLMQYTGLKDKNGKEIYEGDLLIFQGDRDAMFEVFYNDIYGKFSCCRTHYLGSRCGGYVPEIEDKKFEIVGNIYENQELLTNN